MRRRLAQLTFASLSALALSGCPVTDDYFIDESAGLGGSGGEAGTDLAAIGGKEMKPQGGNSSGGSGAAAGRGGSVALAGTSNAGGDALAAMAGAPAGGAADCGATELPCPSACVPKTERCNGHDDNCDGVVDEEACNSYQKGTTGCAGFVRTSRPDHGYMLCTGTQLDYDQAKEACSVQGMRLAWLESEQENTEVASKVGSISEDVEAYIGASDIAMEGSWRWDGGALFWSGGQNGKVASGMFAAWAASTPNNGGGYNTNEDCGVLISGSATWGDRACSIKFAYLCEEAEP